MKKMIILLTMIILTGCGEEKVDEETNLISDYEYATMVDSIISECMSIEDIDDTKEDLIVLLEKYWEVFEIEEGDKNEIVKYFNDRSGYFPEYDLETNKAILKYDYLSLLYIYDAMDGDYSDNAFWEMRYLLDN